MRILLAHHFPLDTGSVGRYVAELARLLQAHKHDVRVLVVGGPDAYGPLAVHKIGCHASGTGNSLPFDVPWFGIEPEGTVTFESLSADHFTLYRDVLRRELDREVDSFDPQIIHAQHIWMWGQLALETGVPYVVNAWGPELVSRARDDRYRPYADQAAENAGRIFVPDEHVRREVLDRFDDVALRVVLAPPVVDDLLVATLINQYLAVLDERFGV